MCMIPKLIAATTAFLLALAITHGCSPQGTKPPTANSPSDQRSQRPLPKTQPLGAASTADDRVADKPREASAIDVSAARREVAPPQKSVDTTPDVKSAADNKPEKPPSAAAENGAEPGAAAPKSDEPLFQGWPKPMAVIVATGMQMGYFEP